MGLKIENFTDDKVDGDLRRSRGEHALREARLSSGEDLG
jgi:hypothetical protein